MHLPLEFLNDHLLETVPLIGLYAETHFRFSIPFSRYYRKEPELLFDTPWRIEPGQNLTLFLVSKDAHLFPVFLEKVTLEIKQGGTLIFSKNWILNQELQDHHASLPFRISADSLPKGELRLFPVLHYRMGSKTRVMRVDNYRHVPKPPLRVIHAQDPLPRHPGWFTGETHLHTTFTDDQVEFGASPAQTRACALQFGLDFFTATDHSYDLDDEPGNYLRNDPELKKWQASRAELSNLNRKPGPAVIGGEEISVANSTGRTVHLLHYNDSKFFTGNADSGEDWPRMVSEYKIQQVLKDRSEDTVSVAAHSGYKFGFLQRLLLKRGSWEKADHLADGLDGVQVLSSTPLHPGFHDSKRLWIDALLSAKKLAVFGGSDSHGNFNRNWHISLPPLKLGMNEDQIFGQVRTLVRSASPAVADLVVAMKAKRTALTTGPVGHLSIDFNGRRSEIGESFTGDRDVSFTVQLTAKSTPEFGKEMDIKLFHGDLQKKIETVIYHEFDRSTEFQDEFSFRPENSGYIRMEISSEGALWPGVYLSTPIWFEISALSDSYSRP